MAFGLHFQQAIPQIISLALKFSQFIKVKNNFPFLASKLVEGSNSLIIIVIPESCIT